MLALSHVAAFAAMLLGVMAIAAVLWLDFRRSDRRQRLVRKVETVLEDENYRRPEERQFKRVA